MPITINQNKIKFKHPTQQGFIEINSVAESTSAELAANLRAVGQEVLATIPDNYETLNNKVNEIVKFQDTAPSTSSTTQVWVDTSSNAAQVAIPTMDEFNNLKNIIGGIPVILAESYSPNNSSVTGVSTTNNGSTIQFTIPAATNNVGVYSSTMFYTNKKYLIAFDISANTTSEIILNTKFGDIIFSGSGHFVRTYNPTSNASNTLYTKGTLAPACTITVTNFNVMEITSADPVVLPLMSNTVLRVNSLDTEVDNLEIEDNRQNSVCNVENAEYGRYFVPFRHGYLYTNNNAISEGVDDYYIKKRLISGPLTNDDIPIGSLIVSSSDIDFQVYYAKLDNTSAGTTGWIKSTTIKSKIENETYHHFYIGVKCTNEQNESAEVDTVYKKISVKFPIQNQKLINYFNTFQNFCDEYTIATIYRGFVDSSRPACQSIDYDSKRNIFYLAFYGENNGTVKRLLVRSSTLTNLNEQNYPPVEMNFGHANDMTYCENNDKLYIACGNEQENGKIAVVNTETLQIESFINPSGFDEDNESIWRISYDPITKRFFVSDNGKICIYNDLSDNPIKTINVNERNIIDYLRLMQGPQRLYSQGSFIYKGTYYTVNAVSTDDGTFQFASYAIVGIEENGNLDAWWIRSRMLSEEGEGFCVKNNWIYGIGNFSNMVVRTFRVSPNTKILSTSKTIYESGTPLNQNQDLNDIMLPGKYVCKSGTIAQTILNKPSEVTSGFTLEVFSLGYAETRQVLISTTNVTEHYERLYNPDIPRWYSWYKLTGFTAVS